MHIQFSLGLRANVTSTGSRLTWPLFQGVVLLEALVQRLTKV
jgi:hypothetical protein